MTVKGPRPVGQANRENHENTFKGVRPQASNPPYEFETPNLPADDEVTVPFNIQVIPEFPRLVLIVALRLVEAGLLMYFKKKMLAK